MSKPPAKNDDELAVDDDDIDLGDLVAAVSKPPAKNDDTARC